LELAEGKHPHDVGWLSGRKRVQPETGIRAVRTKPVACDVLPLRIYGLTRFMPYIWG
jgi:hypothetical protein